MAPAIGGELPETYVTKFLQTSLKLAPAIEQRDHLLARCTAQGQNTAVLVAGGMNPIGQKRPSQPPLEIEPEAGAGKTRVADGGRGAGIASMPAWV
jgi:hypothetical protein